MREAGGGGGDVQAPPLEDVAFGRPTRCGFHTLWPGFPALSQVTRRFPQPTPCTDPSPHRVQSAGPLRRACLPSARSPAGLGPRGQCPGAGGPLCRKHSPLGPLGLRWGHAWASQHVPPRSVTTNAPRALDGQQTRGGGCLGRRHLHLRCPDSLHAGRGLTQDRSPVGETDGGVEAR